MTKKKGFNEKLIPVPINGPQQYKVSQEVHLLSRALHLATYSSATVYICCTSLHLSEDLWTGFSTSSLS